MKIRPDDRSQPFVGVERERKQKHQNSKKADKKRRFLFVSLFSLNNFKHKNG